MTLEELKIVIDNMDAKNTLPVKVRVNFGDEKKSYTITDVQGFHQWSDGLELITAVDTADFMEKIMEFREWLVSETERFQENAQALNASSEGAHYDRGHAAAFISARAKLEELFNYWDCR